MVQPKAIQIVSRIAASLLGSYALVWGFVSFGIPLGVVGGMPYDDAERNMRLFARTVLPRLQALDDAPLGVPRPAAA